MVFDFLEQYRKACNYLSMSENEAFLVFDKFLEGRAKLLFETTIASDRSLSGVCGWPSTVNWCLHTVATDINISRAVTALRIIRQRAGESENEYFGRFSALHTACGSYIAADRLKTLFINGLDGRIVESVHSFLALRPNIDLGLLLKEFQRQGNQVQALFRPLEPFHDV